VLTLKSNGIQMRRTLLNLYFLNNAHKYLLSWSLFITTQIAWSHLD